MNFFIEDGNNWLQMKKIWLQIINESFMIKRGIIKEFTFITLLVIEQERFLVDSRKTAVEMIFVLFSPFNQT